MWQQKLNIQIKDIIFSFFFQRHLIMLLEWTEHLILELQYICYKFHLNKVYIHRGQLSVFGSFGLHCDTSFKTYHYFFSHVKTILGDRIGATELNKVNIEEGFNIGSDDEEAMTKALDVCFQESERCYCSKHMKDNLDHFLIQKEEIDEKRQM